MVNVFMCMGVVARWAKIKPELSEEILEIHFTPKQLFWDALSFYNLIVNKLRF